MPLRWTCLLALAVCSAASARTLHFAGELAPGERFERSIGTRLRFLLIPLDTGWSAEVRLRDGSENLESCICCPLHGPRVFEIQSAEYFGEHRYRATQNDVRAFDFNLTGSGYAKACQELGAIADDVRKGSTSIGSPGYRPPPTGHCTLVIKRVIGKTFIERLSFSVAIQIPG